MKKLLIILLCLPMMFSCGEKKIDEGSLDKEITIEMLKDEYTGKGTVTLPNGHKYVGELKDGFPNGQGTYTYGKGELEGHKYVGEYKDDKRHGQGTYTFGKGPNEGDKYVGEYKDDLMHGQGNYTWPDGHKYVGEWEDNKRADCKSAAKLSFK